MFSPLSISADAANATKADSHDLQCESQGNGFDLLELSCPVVLARGAWQLQLAVNFSGGHDDTMANLSVLLDGEAVACDDRSTTSLNGEYGDVSLRCRFPVSATVAAKPTLKAVIRWSHAEYTGFRLTAER
jgi:hypothetical protein